MKLSVLLPTRNGGRYLRACIESVLAQDLATIELVVSDNANTDETAAILEGFASDSRLVTVTLNEPVDVTTNWRIALEHSSGDYILVIGDDDYLLPDYWSRMAPLLERHGWPECLTYNAYGYVFPAAIHGFQTSYYSDPFVTFGAEFSPGLLPAEQRAEIVREMFRFRSRIPLNMQTTLVARRAIHRLPDGLFQPPFPDHYAINALLLRAQTWAYEPVQPLVIGISPKSFGHFVYGPRQGSGLGYLGIDTRFAGELPGNVLISAMHVWLDRLKRDFPADLAGVEVSRADYVIRQVYASLQQHRAGSLSRRGFAARLRRLSVSDVRALARAMTDRHNVARVARQVRVWRGDKAEQLGHALQPLPGIDSIGAFADAIAAGALSRPRPCEQLQVERVSP